MSTNTPIASQTLTSNAATVTFSNIPQNFTDLVLVMNYRSTRAQTYSYANIRFNFDTGSNYSFTALYGNGSTTGSGRESNSTKLVIYEALGDNATASTYAPNIIQIMNYSNTTTNKTCLVRGGSATGSGHLISTQVGLWRNTSAITSIDIFDGTAAVDIKSGSTFNLYGIVSGSSKATGGTVTTDGTYFYHTFTSSGIFTPSANLTADYLVVAGGAGGGTSVSGSFNGGGGGAGGLRSTVTATGGGGTLETPLTLSLNTLYTVTVGAGGAASTNGYNSLFSTITSTGGGKGAHTYNTAGTSGGSGGGGSTNAGAGGAGTTNQGYAGGTGQDAPYYQGGGGGGAGEIGSTDGVAQGGDGVAVSITGSSVNYAGGGGGGANAGAPATTGGVGGGGAGGINAVGTAGTVNTGGGGGGGGGGANAGGNGGSGIVIIRYAV